MYKDSGWSFNMLCGADDATLTKWQIQDNTIRYTNMLLKNWALVRCFLEGPGCRQYGGHQPRSCLQPVSLGCLERWRFTTGSVWVVLWISLKIKLYLANRNTYVENINIINCKKVSFLKKCSWCGVKFEQDILILYCILILF